NYRNKLKKQINELFLSENTNAVAKALLLGDKTSISTALRETYTRSGAIHILTVSGLHATMIFAIPFFILGKFRLESKIRYITSLSTVFFFTMICGAAPSLLRALLMLSLYTIAKLSKRKTNKYNILCSCAFILVVCDPSIIHNISFQLSFSAVYGIMAFYKRVQQVWKPKKKLWIYTRDMLAVSVAAQTGTLGFSLFHFGQFPLGFLFSTLVVIPLAPLLIALLLTCLFISFLSIDLAQLVTVVIDFILSIQNQSLTLISNQQFLYINNIPFSKIELLAYYTLLIVINSHRRVYNWTSISLMILFSTWIAINENKQLKDLKVDLHRDRIGYILKTNLYGEPIEHRIVLPINTESKLDYVDYCVENKKSP
ncbi:MAG: ComEC/Rec2 family competence protein, partial [Saprospiraceae bacterium]|nr:ComEC/Rec2 family competence protein [Saprospiraceae bacterium]